MMNKKVRIIALLLVLLLAFSACGKKDETPAPVATPESTLMPTAEPTEVPGDVGTEDLDDLEPLEESPVPASSSAKPEVYAPVPTENEESSASTAQPEPSTPVIPEMEDVPAQVIEPETVGHAPNSTEYENYLNMSGAEQVAFIESFDSPADFASWFNAAQADYEAVSNPIEVTTGVIDFAAEQEDSAE